MEWIPSEYLGVVKFIVVSLILLLVYYLIFSRRVKYIHCRVYLIFIPIIAFAISVCNFKVYPAEVIEVEQPATTYTATSNATQYVSKTEPDSEESVVYPNVDIASKAIVETEVVQETKNSENFRFIKEANLIHILYTIYLVLVVTLLIKYLYQMFSIYKIRRWSHIEKFNGLCIVRSNRVLSPFSYFKYIFINHKVEGDVLNVILNHEMSHIENKHYIDTVIIEMLSIVFWFNPFIWLVKRELRDIHEFQVDNNVIESGIEISTYQKIIFAELMGYSPDIANGFHNSQIKKRFIMMNRKISFSDGLAKRLLVIPIIALLFALFAFTKRDDIYVNKTGNTTIMADSAITLRDTLQNALGKASLEVVKNIDLGKVPYNVIKKFNILVDSAIKTLDYDVTKHLGKTMILNPPDIKVVYSSTEDNFFRKDLSYYVHLSAINVTKPTLKSVERFFNETIITVVVPLSENNFYVGSNIELVDIDNNSRLKLRNVNRTLALGRPNSSGSYKNKCIELRLIFPPITGRVKTQNISIVDHTTAKKENCDVFNLSFNNIKISDYYPKSENVELRDEQVVVSNINVSNTQIKTIEQVGENTFVTLVSPIHYDRNWINFDSNFFIREVNTGKIHRIEKLTRDIPLNKTLIVVGKARKSVEFTLVFPKLSEAVAIIDLYEEKEPGKNEAPGNAHVVNPWNWRNVRISDYKPKPKVNYNYNILTDEQTPTIDLGKLKHIKLLSVERTQTATIVKYATEIYFDSQWIYHSSGWVIRDTKTKEKFYIKEMGNNIPLNRVSTIKGKKGKFVCYTLIFPPLPEYVERVDIMKVPHKLDVPYPENNQTTCWYGVDIRDGKFNPNNFNTVSNNRMTHPSKYMTTEIRAKGKHKMTLIIRDKGATSLEIKLAHDCIANIPKSFVIKDLSSGIEYRSDRVIGAKSDGKKGDIIIVGFKNINYGVDNVSIGVFDGTPIDNGFIYENIIINN